MFRFIRLAGVASFCVYRTTLYEKLQLLYDKNAYFSQKYMVFIIPNVPNILYALPCRPGKLSLFKRPAMWYNVAIAQRGRAHLPDIIRTRGLSP